MKTHHWILLVAVVAVVGGLLLWPRAQTAPRVYDELTGRWTAGNTTPDGYDWFMEYTFDDGTYLLKTNTDYREQGTYQITERFLDGSIEIHKTWGDGTYEYTFIILTTEDPNLIYLEGVELRRVWDE